MSLTGIAKETLKIIEQGFYVSPTGAKITLQKEIAHAVENSRLYTPAQLEALLGQPVDASIDREVVAQAGPESPHKLVIEVTSETTSDAARRLVAAGEIHVAALNFASAKNAGGGFKRGAKAQEEDLSRASALYVCLRSQPGYYTANRTCGTLLYTDHMIYSPDVPLFRNERHRLLPMPVFLSFITAPAPNAGAFLHRKPRQTQQVHDALYRRAGMVLAVAKAHKHRTLVLGAWGCGVFQNNPKDVAAAFARWLVQPAFASAFDRIVFGIYDRRKKSPTRDAFVDQFQNESP